MSSDGSTNIDTDEVTLDGPSLVVGVGASAGGLGAFKQLLSALPGDTGMAFILVQHLDPRHKSLLTELLAPRASMRVIEATRDVPLEPDTVYVIPPNTELSVQDGRILLAPPTMRRGVRLPIDHLFSSLAREYDHRSVGIVLSGAGSDGATGLRDIKSRGGLTIAQEPSTATHTGMPRSAIDRGVAELVLVIVDMPAALRRFDQLVPTARVIDVVERDDRDDADSPSLGDDALERLTRVLQAQRGFDPSIYRVATLERRVLRRMMLSGFHDVDTYLDALENDAEQQHALVRDLLISVTDFFRDPGAFEVLRTTVIEPLVTSTSANETIRVWVPGCATGEEAYSIAMEFLDIISRTDRSISLQIFATDIDTDGLHVARTGLYPRSIADHIAPPRLDRYFIKLEGRGFQIKPRVRDVVSFTEHDVCVDPPFSRVHLVSFRNVLIYLRPHAQEKVLGLLHFALLPECHLMLGISESVSQQHQLFSIVSKKWRIYRKVGSSRTSFLRSAAARRPMRDRFEPATAELRSTTRSRGDELARRLLMDTCLPPSLVVSGDGGAIFMHGELRPYLRFPEGSPSLHLGSMLTPELVTRVQATIYRCRRNDETSVVMSSLSDEQQGRTKITAHPANELGEGAVILTFEDVPPDPQVAPSSDQDGDMTLIAQLDHELRATREDLRSTVEELETSNEELRSSNEESLSMNEELQSTNEELEATTEELRSLNEELHTVNVQLREKLEQLERAHDDLVNFFASTKIATIFLDEELCIKRFTPAAEELLHIDHNVEGRFVGDVSRQLLQDGLVDQARRVLEHLSAERAELYTTEGRWISRGVLPYRTQSRRIEGVVVTLVDVSELKAATKTLAVRERQQAVIARLGLLALEDSGLQGFLAQVVREVQQTLGTDMCKILELEPGGRALLLRAGVGWNEGLVGRAIVDSGMDSQAGFTLHAQGPIIVDDLAEEQRFNGPVLLQDHGVKSGISCIIRDGAHPYGVLGAHTRQHRVFTFEDTNFVQGVAAVVAAAVGRQQVRMQLALEGASAKALATSTGLHDAVGLIHEALAHEVGVIITELWEPDAKSGTTIRRTALFTRPPYRREQVEQALSASSMSHGEGTVGRVFQLRRAEWLSVPQSNGKLVRAKAAQSLGLSSSLALPIVAADEVLGVIAVFTRERFYAARPLLQGLEAIGRAIGESARRTTIESESRRLAAIAEAAQDAIISLDLDGVITGWLPGAHELYGYSEAEMLGSSIERIVPDDRHAELRDALERLRGGKQLEPVETRGLGQGGQLVDVSTRFSPLHDDRGRLVGMTRTDRDITERRRASAALAESEQRFRGTFENAAVGIAHIEPGPRLVCRRINDRLLQILGYSREEMLERTLEEVTHPDHVDQDLANVHKLLSGQIDHFSSEKRYIRRDGTTIWVHVTASLALKPDETPDYAIIVVEDISSRKDAELRRAESEWRFRQVLLCSPVPMLVCDDQGRIVARSDSWTEMFGYSAEEVTTLQAWAERVYGEHAPGVLDHLERLWAAAEPGPAPDVDARTKGGRCHTLMLSGATLGRTADGQTLRLCAAADVTRQKNAERELLEASRQKDEFLAMLGHELRNPLAAVHGAVRLPSFKQIDDPRLSETRAILERQTAHMSKLLDGLLDVSRIIRGKITLDVQVVDLRELLCTVVRDYTPRAADKGLTLEAELGDEPRWVDGDPVRLTQIVDNLLSNALKYTDAGTITVHLQSDEAEAVLTVRDTGIGIEPDLLPRIYDSFRQAQQSLHRTRGGLGLGLALVRSLVELHHGQIEAQSDGPGKGTRFVVTFPRVHAPPTSPPQLAPSTPTRILVVEDEKDLARVLQQILESNGHEVRIATLGREGIAIAQQWQPDIVLCDLGLPDGVSGYDVARTLRGDAATCHILLAAVTGYGRPMDKASARQAGFDAHLTKPVDLEALETVIAELLQRHRECS